MFYLLIILALDIILLIIAKLYNMRKLSQIRKVLKVSEIFINWGLEGIYETRQIMNKKADEIFDQSENELDIIAFGLRSFRDAKTNIVKEKIKRGLKIRIITLDPSSEFVTQREKDEKEVPGQIRKTIQDLIKWIDDLKKESPDPENVSIKFYNSLPQDFYFRIDNHIFLGPYLYGKTSQQTISYEFKGDSAGYKYYKEYFDNLWDDPEFCQINE